MFSRLDSFFQTQFRHAEQLDTRLGIRRQENDAERKKGERKEQNDDPDAGEDLATVSVEALIAFLGQLLPQDATVKNEAPVATQPRGSSEAVAPSPQTKAAIRAYERNTAPTQLYNPPATSALPELTSEEIRIIHDLLPRLKALYAEGKRHITLRKSTSFLQSMVEAVALNKD